MDDVEVKVDPDVRENGGSSCEKMFLRACAVELALVPHLLLSAHEAWLQSRPQISHASNQSFTGRESECSLTKVSRPSKSDFGWNQPLSARSQSLLESHPICHINFTAFLQVFVDKMVVSTAEGGLHNSTPSTVTYLRCATETARPWHLCSFSCVQGPRVGIRPSTLTKTHTAMTQNLLKSVLSLCPVSAIEHYLLAAFDRSLLHIPDTDQESNRFRALSPASLRILWPCPFDLL